jgi:hypothetical protein
MKQHNNYTTDGNVSIGATNVGENWYRAKRVLQESVSKPIDGGRVKEMLRVSLDHAKDQIEKEYCNGILYGAERVNLGITWADIRKGEKDIKAGKVNTVPAKKINQALKVAKKRWL